MNFRADPETTLSGLDARGAVPLPFAVSKEDLFSNLNDSNPLLREHFREERIGSLKTRFGALTFFGARRLAQLCSDFWSGAACVGITGCSVDY